MFWNRLSAPSFEGPAVHFLSYSWTDWPLKYGATVRPETSVITAKLRCVKSQKNAGIATCSMFLVAYYFYAVCHQFTFMLCAISSPLCCVPLVHHYAVCHQFTIITVLWERTQTTALLMLPSSDRLSENRVRQHSALDCRQCPILPFKAYWSRDAPTV